MWVVVICTVFPPCFFKQGRLSMQEINYVLLQYASISSFWCALASFAHMLHTDSHPVSNIISAHTHVIEE